MAKIAQETLAEETAQTNPDNTSLMAIVQQLQAEINKLKDQKKSGSNTHKEHYE